MKIEKVSTADAEKLLAIYAPYVEETAISFEYEVPSVDVFRNRIEQISAKYPYIKAVVDGKLIGQNICAGQMPIWLRVHMYCRNTDSIERMERIFMFFAMDVSFTIRQLNRIVQRLLFQMYRVLIP